MLKCACLHMGRGWVHFLGSQSALIPPSIIISLKMHRKPWWRRWWWWHQMLRNNGEEHYRPRRQLYYSKFFQDRRSISHDQSPKRSTTSMWQLCPYGKCWDLKRWKRRYGLVDGTRSCVRTFWSVRKNRLDFRFLIKLQTKSTKSLLKLFLGGFFLPWFSPQ